MLSGAAQQHPSTLGTKLGKTKKVVMIMKDGIIKPQFWPPKQKSTVATIQPATKERQHNTVVRGENSGFLNRPLRLQAFPEVSPDCSFSSCKMGTTTALEGC